MEYTDARELTLKESSKEGKKMKFNYISNM